MSDIVHSQTIQAIALNAGMDASALQVSGDWVCLTGTDGHRELIWQDTYGAMNRIVRVGQ